MIGEEPGEPQDDLAGIGRKSDRRNRHLVRRLSVRIKDLLDRLGADLDPGTEASVLNSLSLTLQRLQSVERTALGIKDGEHASRPAVVIVVPAMAASESEWVKAVAQDVTLEIDYPSQLGRRPS